MRLDKLLLEAQIVAIPGFDSCPAPTTWNGPAADFPAIRLHYRPRRHHRTCESRPSMPMCEEQR